MLCRIDFLPLLLMSVTRLTPTVCVKACLVDVPKVLVSPGTKMQKRSGRIYSIGNYLDEKATKVSASLREKREIQQCLRCAYSVTVL